MIGPNGAGKTTFFNMLTGLYRPSAGPISFAGRRDLAGPARPDHRDGDRAHLPEHPPVPDDVGARERDGRPARAHARRALRLDPAPAAGARARSAGCARRAREMLAYAGLPERLFEQTAANLSYGDQRRVEIARALASEPSVLLLDEPTAGMNPSESEALTAFIRKAARRARADDPADRARHEGGDGRLRADHRARPRGEDRRGHARRRCAATRG